MSHIKTRPPFTKSEIEGFISRLESVKTQVIDGVVLSNIVRACYECALKNEDLIGLSVGDVAKAGKINDSMSIDNKPTALTDRAKTILQNHIDYLKNNGYQMYPSKPLFPTKHKKRYYYRLLDNHLKNDAIIGEKIGLEKVRQAGICNYYEQMKQKGFSVSQCLEETKIFAQHQSYRATKDLLRGKIQSTGKKDYPFLNYLKEIEGVGFQRIKTRTYPEIQRAIEKDPELNDDEKRGLKTELESSIKHAKERSARAMSSPTVPRFKSITEAIKNIDPDELS